MTEMRPVDFKKIQEKISFVKILEYYEIELREEGKSLVGQGPLCSNEQSASPAGFFMCDASSRSVERHSLNVRFPKADIEFLPQLR